MRRRGRRSNRCRTSARSASARHGPAHRPNTDSPARCPCGSERCRASSPMPRRCRSCDSARRSASRADLGIDARRDRRRRSRACCRGARRRSARDTDAIRRASRDTPPVREPAASVKPAFICRRYVAVSIGRGRCVSAAAARLRSISASLAAHSRTDVAARRDRLERIPHLARPARRARSGPTPGTFTASSSPARSSSDSPPSAPECGRGTRARRRVSSVSVGAGPPRGSRPSSTSRRSSARRSLARSARARSASSSLAISPTLASNVDVAPLPEAGDRRHVVGVRRGERELRIALRRLEAAVVSALEVQHLRRQHAPLLERRRHVGRHGAEVFADDERVVAHALERDDAEQIVAHG